MKKRYIERVYRDEDSDEKVWEELKKGSIGALKTLFLRHHIHLYNYAMKLSGDRFMAEDCVHDLFYRIWERRDHLSDVQSVKGYLWISLRRALLKTMNSNSSEVLTDDILQHINPDIEQQGDSGIYFSPEEFIIRSEEKSEHSVALARALNHLPSRQREAIYLKFFNGMGYDEMEQVMSVSYQTARNYVYDGVQSLKKHFKDESKKLVPHVLLIILFFLLV